VELVVVDLVENCVIVLFDELLFDDFWDYLCLGGSFVWFLLG